MRENTNWHKCNEEKRQRILDKIKPLCELFRIEQYDYEIKEVSEDGFYTQEYLILEGQRIGCTGNSENITFYEAVGYVIIKRYCNWKSLGAFEKQTQNYIKRYWLKGEQK